MKVCIDFDPHWVFGTPRLNPPPRDGTPRRGGVEAASVILSLMITLLFNGTDRRGRPRRRLEKAAGSPGRQSPGDGGVEMDLRPDQALWRVRPLPGLKSLDEDIELAGHCADGRPAGRVRPAGLVAGPSWQVRDVFNRRWRARRLRAGGSPGTGQRRAERVRARRWLLSWRARTGSSPLSSTTNRTAVKPPGRPARRLQYTGAARRAAQDRAGCWAAAARRGPAGVRHRRAVLRPRRPGPRRAVVPGSPAAGAPRRPAARATPRLCATACTTASLTWIMTSYGAGWAQLELALLASAAGPTWASWDGSRNWRRRMLCSKRSGDSQGKAHLTTIERARLACWRQAGAAPHPGRQRGRASRAA